MILLAVVRSLSDEPYKIRAVKMYMVDYLDNICAFRLKRQRTSDRDFIDVIAAENSGKQAFQPAYQGSAGVVAGASRENAPRENVSRENASREAYQASQENFGQMTDRTGRQQCSRGQCSRTLPGKAKETVPRVPGGESSAEERRSRSLNFRSTLRENHAMLKKREMKVRMSRDLFRQVF